MKEHDSLNERVPFVAIGNEELGENLGPMAECPNCQQQHPIFNSTPKPILQYVNCEEKSWLVGVNGRVWKHDTR